MEYKLGHEPFTIYQPIYTYLRDTPYPRPRKRTSDCSCRPDSLCWSCLRLLGMVDQPVLSPGGTRIERFLPPRQG